MTADAKNPRPERDETDESLRVERENTDEVITARNKELEQKADVVVERARKKADAVLDTARAQADDRLDETDHGDQASDAIARQRAREDDALRAERAAEEREERAQFLASLLPLEREKTDRHLLTERVRSDDALARRDDFMGMVSHDLRNLLSGIVLHAAVLAKKDSGSPEGQLTRDTMGRIQRYAARMNRLIGDLIDVVSIDAGKLAVCPAPGDAVSLLREAIDMFAPSAAGKGIALVSETVERALPAAFDHERMLQVLANLITNAIKFTPQGGRIVIRGERIAGEIHLSVRDTGVGIAADMIEGVFERFWQVGKNDRMGLGLGLYIAKCIVTAHGGKIWAESTLGAGSTFHVTLPTPILGTA
jgi:signal transduction histidine kinase